MMKQPPATATKAELRAYITQLQLALATYTDATGVASWGYEELNDQGLTARHALGYGEHAADCAWPNNPRYIPGPVDPETGEEDISQAQFIGSERCTCGLEDHIEADMAVWSPAANISEEP